MMNSRSRTRVTSEPAHAAPQPASINARAPPATVRGYTDVRKHGSSPASGSPGHAATRSRTPVLRSRTACAAPKPTATGQTMTTAEETALADCAKERHQSAREDTSPHHTATHTATQTPPSNALDRQLIAPSPPNSQPRPSNVQGTPPRLVLRVHSAFRTTRCGHEP